LITESHCEEWRQSAMTKQSPRNMKIASSGLVSIRHLQWLLNQCPPRNDRTIPCLQLISSESINKYKIHEMKISLEDYRQSREVLLANLVTELSSDERFVAAWLTGSYGREDADEVSDLDLNLVVARPYSGSLCTRAEQVSHRSTAERFALFSKFGTPALIHENNNNAPEGGTFTFVLYGESAIMVDWTLVPLVNAKRSYESQLLFDKANIPIAALSEVEELEQSKKSVAEMWAFFWMMTAITIKYIIRGDSVFVTHWLEELHAMSHEIERRINRLPRQYTRGSLSQFQPTRERQLESIRQLCNKMRALTQQVTQFIGFAPASPLAETETLLSFAKE